MDYLKTLSEYSESELQEMIFNEVMKSDSRTELYKLLMRESNRRYKARTGNNGGSR